MMGCKCVRSFITLSISFTLLYTTLYLSLLPVAIFFCLHVKKIVE